MNSFWTVSLFWIAAVACVVVALAFVLPALMRARSEEGKAARRDVNIAVYRDQLKEMEADRANGLLSDAQYGRARTELEARLADDTLAPDTTAAPGHAGSRRMGYTLGAVLPAAAFGLYFWLGNPASLVAGADARAPDAAMTGAEHDFGQLIRKAEEKALANPEDGEAWALLARSYAFMERWPDAFKAYEKAAALVPRDASVLSGYAEALALANNRVLTGKPMELVRQALAIDPNDTKGLELSAIHAYQEQNFAEAGAYFGRLHQLLPPQSPYAQEILAAQQEAERLAGSGATTSAAQPPAGDRAVAAAAGATINGRIDIAPALRSSLKDTDVLFLFARSGAGGPPVAAIRASAGQLPLDFELDDRAAMNPGNSLSQHKQVKLVARVSRSGDPMARPGDLEGSAANVAVGASGVEIVIDQIRP
jgi:cytochrome c-type biogenesis protein CcmH